MSWLQKIASKVFVKTAKKNSPSTFSDCTFNGPNTFNINSGSGFTSDDDPSDTFTTIIRKNDRNASDSYRVWITKSANYQGLSLALEVKAERDGMLAYSNMWKFSEPEFPLMEKTFNSLIDISKNIKMQVESEQIPTALIGPMFKNGIQSLSKNNREGSRGVDNYRRNLDEPIEYDWRQSLYGNRYPSLEQIDPVKVEMNLSQQQNRKPVGSGRNKQIKTHYHHG